MKEEKIWEEDSWEDADYLPRVYIDGLRVSAKAGEGVSEDVLREHERRRLAPSDQDRLRSLIYMERAASAQRRLLHARIDFIRSHGDATQADDAANHIDGLVAKERSLSAYRKTLHQEIDQLRHRASG